MGVEKRVRKGEVLLEKTKSPGQETGIRNYRRIAQLGSGGDGMVELVRYLPTDQLRAAKKLKAGIPGDELHELNMMKKLRHPSLPQIIDVIEEGGEYWLIMEYIDGICLSDACCGQISAAQFYSVARQLCEVLSYLHTRPDPILHLDIKPSNVLLKKDGRLVLIDFGASVLSHAGQEEHLCRGTPGFAAPEQKNPDCKVDERTDVYGAGALLYYYLYGTTAPSPIGKGGACGGQKMQSWRRPLWIFQAEHLLNRCLREDREQRFQNMEELSRAVRRSERWYQRIRQSLRNAGAVFFLLAAVVFAAGSMREGRADAETARREKYERLLEMAETLGFVQALGCYEEAALLMPGEGAWCLRLLARIEADYTFSLEEENALKQLLYMASGNGGRTIAECLAGEFSGFGEIAYRIGLSYWYFYEGSGGKNAASNWFGQALAAVQGQETEWKKSAEIHADIGRYYEKLGRRDENGKLQTEYGVYWQDLASLWELESVRRESAGIRHQVADELLTCMIMHAAELQQSGIKWEDLQRLLASVEEFAEEEQSQAGAEGVLEGAEKCRAAKAALQRVFGQEEGGSEIETKES